jgi:hypothetical protein
MTPSRSELRELYEAVFNFNGEAPGARPVQAAMTIRREF